MSGKHASHARTVAPSNKLSVGSKILLFVIAFIIAGMAVITFSVLTEKRQVEAVIIEDIPESQVEDKIYVPPKSPINWAEQQAINSDIYGWIEIPNTEVNYPILQSSNGDVDYYLYHTAEGKSDIKGEIYSQFTQNSKDFTQDPLTVLYGHTFDVNNTMFGTLHNFEDPDFFAANKYFYIYTPEANLKYYVVSAYEWSDELILDEHDMTDANAQQEYFNIVTDPESKNPLNRRIRGDFSLTAGKDHIVQLSTCTKPANDSKRYLVTGSLVEITPVAQ